MKQTLLFFSLLFFTKIILANNITISNVSLINKNLTTHSYNVTFDIAWENSWRTSTNESNYDGAWVFFKYRQTNTTEWKHLKLNFIFLSTAGAGAEITLPTDNAGLFIYRSANGLGNVNFTGNQVTWSYGLAGVQDNQTVEIKAFAVEMVNIPEGPFNLGTGSQDVATFKNASAAIPFFVTNSSITFSNTGNNLYSTNPSVTLPLGTILPGAFPRGFSAFWLMKYETTQQQYADFHNNLTQAQSAYLLSLGNYSSVNFLSGIYPNLTAVFPEGPIYGYNGVFINSMADWAGLRPYTEMEYEKACRGANITALPFELAWGATESSMVTLTSVNDSATATESVNVPANANYAASFAARVGIFARATGSSRLLSGATYYGVMNMSDNAQELVIGIDMATTFNGTVTGDGQLSINGTTDITSWTNTLYFTKGGGFRNDGSGAGYYTVSNRLGGSFSPTNSGSFSTGIRLARNAF